MRFVTPKMSATAIANTSWNDDWQPKHAPVILLVVKKYHCMGVRLCCMSNG